MRVIAVVFTLLALALPGMSQSTNVPSLAQEVVMLKTNGVSDAVILAYLREGARKARQPSVIPQKIELDPESYAFFWRYYLLPRAEASRNRILRDRRR